MMTLQTIGRVLTCALLCVLWVSAPLAAQEPLGAAELESMISELPAQELSAKEIRQLRYFLEAQKLLRDVYAKFYTRWHLHDFQKFKRTKHRQLQAWLHLFEKYDLSPALELQSFGLFSNNTLQKLYTNFTMTGRLSLFEALRTSATMEDLNIYTAFDFLGLTDNQDIKLTCRTMALTSRNNLQEITALLDSYGEELGGNIWMW